MFSYCQGTFNFCAGYATGKKKGYANSSLGEDFFEEFESTRIVGLTEPEHGLLADFGIAVGLGDFDEFGDTFILR